MKALFDPGRTVANGSQWLFVKYFYFHTYYIETESQKTTANMVIKTKHRRYQRFLCLKKCRFFLKRKNNIKNYCNYYHYYYYHYFWKWTSLVNSRGQEANNYSSFYFYVLLCIVIHQNQNSGSFILFFVLIAVCCS